MRANITSISNITLEPYFSKIIKEIFNDLIEYNFLNESDLYSQQAQDLLNTSDYILLLFDFESKYSNYFELYDNNLVKRIIDDSAYIYNYVSNNTNGIIIWVSYETLHNNLYNVLGDKYELSLISNRVNYQLSSILDENDIFLDFTRVIAKVGINESFNYVNKYRWNSIYSKKLIYALCNEIKKQVDIERSNTPKCIIVDCDNVLWGGTLLDDGLENIKLAQFGEGSKYRDFQKFLLQLNQMGILIAVCSKNDLEDVLKMFDKNEAMVLKKNNISVFMANWENKSYNIEVISKTLNLSLKDIVFVDDSINEIEEVKALLPDVYSVLFNLDEIYQKLSIFNLKKRNNIEIQKRLETYKTNALREKLKGQDLDINEYIQSLETIVDIHIATNTELSRISELTFRTNRCTNGIRMNVKQLKVLFNNGRLFAVCVRDKFSDMGLVGCIGVEDNKLVVFSLSCRVIGRSIEKKMIEDINNIVKLEKYEFVSTGKNEWLKEMFDTYCHI